MFSSRPSPDPGGRPALGAAAPQRSRNGESPSNQAAPKRRSLMLPQPGWMAFQPKTAGRPAQTPTQSRPLLDDPAGRPMPGQRHIKPPNQGVGLGLITQAPATSATTRLPPAGSRLRERSHRKGPAVPAQGASSLISDSRTGYSGGSSSNSSSKSPSLASQQRPGAKVDRRPTDGFAASQAARLTESWRGVAPPASVYPELDRYRDLQPPSLRSRPSFESLHQLDTEDIPPPPTPLFSAASSQLSAFSASPSTRFSESPSGGPYSRDTTPTSISSYSPSFIAPSRMPGPPARLRKQLPEKPQLRRPATHARIGGALTLDLSADEPAPPDSIRVSSNSSSSTSTVRAGEKPGGKTKKSLAQQRPPSPPPRQSSQKFRKTKETSESSSNSTRVPSKPSGTSSSSQVSPPGRIGLAQAAQPSPPKRIAPPRQLSRDAPMGPSPVIELPPLGTQVNLSTAALPTAERRRSRLMLGRSHAPSPRPNGPGHSRLPVGREATQASTVSPAPASNPARPPAKPSAIRAAPPSVSTSFKSRFPLFGRRSKPVAEKEQPPAEEKEEKDRPQRKGPVAGTGHEGYGRIGAIRRRSSSLFSTARTVPAAAPLQESLLKSLYRDSFLADRLSPVVIAGGEIIENQNKAAEVSRPGSNQSDVSSRYGTESQGSPHVSPESPRDFQWPGTFSPYATQNPSPHSRRPSDSSDADELWMKPGLSVNISTRGVQPGGQGSLQSPGRLIIANPNQVLSPSETSLDASVLSQDPPSDLPPAASELRRAGTGDMSSSSISQPTSKKLTKRTRSPRRWNFFGRARHDQQPASATKKEASEPAAVAVAATVQSIQAPVKQPLAFYTMMDPSEHDDTDPVDLEDVLREARATRDAIHGSSSQSDQTGSEPASEGDRKPSGATSATFTSRSVSRERPPTASSPVRKPAVGSGRLSVASSTALDEPVEHQAAPGASPAETKQEEVSQEATLAQPTFEALSPKSQPTLPPPKIPPAPVLSPLRTRPSRLPAVGRIPKIISVRSGPPSLRSFSRPFNQGRMVVPPSLLKGPAADKNPLAMTAWTSASAVRGPEQLEESSPTETGPVPPAPAPAPPSATENQGLRMLQPPSMTIGYERAGPNLFCISSRTSQASVTTIQSEASAIHRFPDLVATANEVHGPLVEDEIWDEYDDLISDESLRVPPSIGSSMGRPFHLEKYEDEARERAEPLPLESPTIHPMKAQQSLGQALWLSDPGTPPPAAATGQEQRHGSVALASSPLEAAGALPNDDGGFVASSPSEQQPPHRAAQQRSSPGRRTRQSNASGSSRASSEDNSPLSQVNLRIGSMTVSKWLSFGHVLFSPVRDQLMPVTGSLRRPSILVIDGLGNDDWSFYASETYPAATFFNMSPRAPPRTPPAERAGDTSSSPVLSPASGSSSALPNPPNHHQIQYLSHAQKFPFGPQSFTCVVFRFPAAAPEAWYRNIISEARRVLKPGGFLELSILDVDLNNMGNRARRAVRQLKERIHAHAPDTSLSSTSDLVLRLMGRRGFIDIKTCRVGVPVASGSIAAASVVVAGGGGGDVEAGSSRARTGSASTSIITSASTSTSSGGSGASQAGRDSRKDSSGNSSITSSQAAPKKHKRKDTGNDLAEMMSNGAPVADESITKMVAKVGRWWYSRCYEGAALAVPGAGTIMWNDRALLAECEERGTSLKLMVCHARMPEVSRAPSL